MSHIILNHACSHLRLVFVLISFLQSLHTTLLNQFIIGTSQSPTQISRKFYPIRAMCIYKIHFKPVLLTQWNLLFVRIRFYKIETIIIVNSVTFVKC